MGAIRQTVRQHRNQLRDRVATQVFQGRLQRQWSQHTLARRAQCSERTIRRIEHREHLPRPVVLDRLDSLLTSDDNPN